MHELGDFKLFHFFNYPPYFTLQPVRETCEKQVQLWKELILEYCRTQKIFVIGLEEEFSLFSKSVIERKRYSFKSSDTSETVCYICLTDSTLIKLVKDNEFEDSVMTVEEIHSRIESRGTELQGIGRKIIMRALKLLEQKGKLAIFKGTLADDEGVKFFI
ncbi:hypothetical protein DITRI_Ditri04bG0085700 [Diplodiscus trichospermus]